MSKEIEVYKAIAAVAQELSSVGISKDQKNAQQGYKFRGIDDVYNTLAPIISKNGLVIMPRVLSREVTEKVTTKGTTLFYVSVEVEFDFISSVDGSVHTAKTFGEAMDSGDKATNKAMSAAYKYVCFQAFCIPTHGDNDADATTHDEIKGLTSADFEVELDQCGTIEEAEAWATVNKGRIAESLNKTEKAKLTRYYKGILEVLPSKSAEILKGDLPE